MDKCLYVRHDGVGLKPDDKIWCGLCRTHYAVKKLKSWDNEGGCPPVLLCPGCG